MLKGIASSPQYITIQPYIRGLWAIPLLLLMACNSPSNSSTDSSEKGLKDYYSNFFEVGVAVSGRTLQGRHAELIKANFSTLTAENAMKPAIIQPEEGVFNWEDADRIADFARANGIKVRGHTLVWHEQSPAWFHKPDDGFLSKEILYQRMKTHIDSLVSRYKDVVCCWDVVNEAVDDDSTNIFRPTKWYQLCGMEYLVKAFQLAREADPNAKLFYNDYNIVRPEKRERTYEMLRMLLEAGAPIDGVGIQGHWSIFEPSEDELRAAIERYASLGLEIHITEMDISIYPWEKERRARLKGESDELTPELEQKQIEQYTMAFRLFREYSDVVTNVTLWGLTDDASWLNNYPVRGRRNYPLLFNKDIKPKRVYWEIVNFDGIDEYVTENDGL